MSESKFTELEAFVMFAHANQYRRGGEEPYVEHVKRVAVKVYDYTKSMDAMAVALMHDVVEDTPFTFEDCNHFLVSEQAKEALVLLTKTEDMSTEEYMSKLLKSGNQIALIVKYFDAIDNAEFTEEGRAFTINVLKRDPDRETRKYIRRANQCLEAFLKLQVNHSSPFYID